MRALIYARASHDPGKRGRSTGSQVESCRRECADRGWEVVDVIKDDDRSGSEWATKEREGWARVLEAIQDRAIDVLVMWEASRGTRTLAGWVEQEEALRAAGVLLSYGGDLLDLSKTADRYRAALEIVGAQQEAGKIRDRILRSKLDDARAGRPSGPVPYGYTRVYSATDGRLLEQVPDPVTAAVVREMAQEVLDGVPLNAIAQRLNREGIATPKPPRDPLRVPRWTAQHVRQVLLGPAIAGLRRHQRHGQRLELYPAVWEPLIPREDWDTIGAVLRDPSRIIHRGVAPKHLLSHIARCGECGTPVRYISKGNGAYTCGACGGIYIAAPPTDQVVTETLMLWLEPQLDVVTGATSPDPEVERARAEIERLEAEFAAGAALVAEGKLSVAGYAQLEEALQRKVDAARRAGRVTPPNPVLLDLAGSGDLRGAWEGMDLTDRRALLRGLVDIRLHKAARRGGRRFDPNRVEVRPRE